LGRIIEGWLRVEWTPLDKHNLEKEFQSLKASKETVHQKAISLLLAL